MRRAVLLALLLTGCAAKPADAPADKSAPAPAAVAAPAIEIPARLRSCPMPPTAPPAPRTVEQLGAYAIALEANRAECAYRLKRLVDLVEGK